MAKISEWMKRRFGSKRRSEKKSSGQLPSLPSLRRSITPTSFDTPACLFFQLPYEIRTLILLAAFGGRTLHMDLLREENAWRWRGTVCYRNMYQGDITILPSMRFSWSGPWVDRCLENYDRERERKVELPEKYKIGIAGFLLSCKQAYAEGIHVLYSANRIHIQSEPLLLHLPQVIPENRLKSITSLEILITANRIQQQNGTSSFDVDHLEPILGKIATHLHHLRSLCLSFRATSHSHKVLDGPALPWIDAFYHSTQLREMTVELPYSDYLALAPTSQLKDHTREAPTQEHFRKSVWRSLDDGEPSMQYRYIERYPRPPLKLPEHDSGDDCMESAGYWLSDGDPGPVRHFVCSIGG